MVIVDVLLNALDGYAWNAISVWSVTIAWLVMWEPHLFADVVWFVVRRLLPQKPLHSKAGHSAYFAREGEITIEKGGTPGLTLVTSEAATLWMSSLSSC